MVPLKPDGLESWGNGTAPRPSGSQIEGPARPAPSHAINGGPKVKPSPSALSARPTAQALLLALRRRWLLASTVGAALAACTAVAALWLMPPPKYTARTLMRVPPETRFLMQVAEPLQDRASYQRTQVALVKSRLVLNSALKQPRVAELSVVREQLAPVEWLEQEVQVDYSVAPEIMRIAMTGQRAEELVVLVDGLREAYRKEILDKERIGRSERLTLLGQLRERYEGQLRIRKEEQRPLEQEAGGREAGSRALLRTFVQQQLNWDQREILQLDSELRKARIELHLLREGGKGGGPPVPEEALEELVNKHESLSVLLAQERELKKLIEDTLKVARNGEKDPGVVAYRQRLEANHQAQAAQRGKLRKELAAEFKDKARSNMGQRESSLTSRIALLEESKGVLIKETERLREQLQDMAKSAFKLDVFREDLSLLEGLTKRIASEEEALKIELQAPSRVRVVEEGVITGATDPRRRLFNIGLVTLGAFALGLLAVSYREFRARRVDRAEEVASGLGVRLLGSTPESSPRRLLGFGLPRNRYADSLLTESVDMARTALLQVAREQPLQVVMITSAVGGEGKTSLTAHLAASLALIGHKTLFIDADLRNPNAHRVLALQHPARTGLSEVLRGEVDVADAVRPTAVQGLWVLPAGRWDSAASRAIPQEHTASVFRRLRQKFDFILMDTSPVLPVADPLQFAQYADGVLLSVLRNVSSMISVHAAYARLISVGVRALGVIVNAVPGVVYTGSYYHSPTAADPATANH